MCKRLGFNPNLISLKCDLENEQKKKKPKQK